MKARKGTARREPNSNEGSQRRKLEDERINTHTTRHAVCMQTYLFRYSMQSQYLLDIDRCVCTLNTHMLYSIHTYCTQYTHTVLNTHILYSIHTYCAQYIHTVLNTYILYSIHTYCAQFTYNICITIPCSMVIY